MRAAPHDGGAHGDGAADRDGAGRRRAEMRNTRMWGVVAAAIVTAALVSGVTIAQDFQPTCRNCPATYISTKELQAYVIRAKAQNIVDQQVRAIDLGKMNTGIGIVHRGKLTEQAPGSVAEHDLVGEIYYII